MFKGTRSKWLMLGMVILLLLPLLAACGEGEEEEATETETAAGRPQSLTVVATQRLIASN